jgi:hypothetical protein
MRGTIGILSGLIGMVSLLSGCADKTLSETIEGFEYIELVPPTVLVPPGSIVAILKPNPLSAELVCTSKQSLGADLAPEKSDSVAMEIKKKTTSTFKIDASYLEALKATGKYESVKDVKLTLSNVSVHELSTATLVEHKPNRPQACTTAIAVHRANKQKVTMIKSVIRADVVYTVEFKDSVTLEVGLKKGLVKGLAADLGFTATETTETTIKGVGLIWGIRDNEVLVDLEGVRPFGSEPPEKPVFKAGGHLRIEPK